MSNTALKASVCCDGDAALVQRVIAGGTIVICYQCRQCGRQSGPAIARAAVVGWETLPHFDMQILETAWAEAGAKYAYADSAKREERLRKYADHINSAKWSRLRSRVMMRARQGAAFPMCEGCGDRPATEVHHLTYQNLGEEFLWELAAVCDHCHERLHHTNAANEA